MNNSGDVGFFLLFFYINHPSERPTHELELETRARVCVRVLRCVLIIKLLCNADAAARETFRSRWSCRLHGKRQKVPFYTQTFILLVALRRKEEPHEYLETPADVLEASHALT